MKLVIFLILFCSIAIVLHSKGTSYPIINLQATAETRVSTEEIAELIHDEFGPDVQVASSILQNYYLIGDFNGDGNADIAVIVKPEGGKTKIGKFNVNFISIDPYSLKNGQEIDPVAITRGGITEYYLDLYYAKNFHKPDSALNTPVYRLMEGKEPFGD